MRHTCLAAAILLTVVLQGPTPAEARANYPGLIPRAFSCATCHINPAGGGSRNSFGADFSNHGRTWRGVFDLDSDRDGFTNGEELGDPEGRWQPGDPDPRAIASRPGDANDVPIEEGCGNGVREQGEDCDVGDLGEASCASVGFEGGTLLCGDQCRFDTTLCRLCGNGVREEGEDCDGFDTGGQACILRGFDQGRIVCTEDCALDDSGCTICGDGVKEGDEACDGEDLGGATCESLMSGKRGGLGCLDDCTIDASVCIDGGTIEPDRVDPDPALDADPAPAPLPATSEGCVTSPGEGAPGPGLLLMLALWVFGRRRRAR